MPINVVGFKWGEGDDNHKYDYNALENIPTTDIGELDVDTTAASGTDDGDLVAAINSFSWSDVITNNILKVKKLLTKIITQVKTNTSTLSNLGDAATETVANNLTTTSAGYVLDARQGRALDTAIDELETSLNETIAGINTNLGKLYTTNNLQNFVYVNGSHTYSSNETPMVLLQDWVDDGKIPAGQAFVLRASMGSQYWGVGLFYQANSATYGSAIVGTYNRQWLVFCNNNNWKEYILGHTASLLSTTINTNNGTVQVQWYTVGRTVVSSWKITPASSWGTGSSNRITCTIPSAIPSSVAIYSGVELNGIFAHLSGTTFRAQNNTGGSLSASSSYDVTIIYVSVA